jgi:hypothetical protein
MQGTFDFPDKNGLDELDECNHCSGDKIGIDDGDEWDESMDQPKRTRLEAMANVPWGNLAPANDKATQRRMRDHWERESSYIMATDTVKPFIPKVSPYPEGPDTVFPGTPCYKITVDWRTRYVFVLDPIAHGYPTGWNGQCRAQTAARWIVSHFIYRNEKMVNLMKKRWQEVYEHNTVNGIPPPRKDDYVGNLPGLPAPAVGEPARSANDSYYVPGAPNTCPGAPEIEDPVLSPAFNNNNIFVGHNRIVPFPYEQD